MMEINQQQVEKIRGNQKIRQRLAFESPFWFSLLYLKDHFKHSFAPFHMEMFHLIQQVEHDFIVIMAFRESGKSTVMNMANIIWSILGKPEKKFVLIISKTQEQAKNHFSNIKAELEQNELLKEDFGPFTENESEWNKLSLELEYHGSKILSITKDQSIRGLKYGRFRPDLIICDDLEDSYPENSRREASNQTQELYKHLSNEIVTVGSTGTRIIVLGNLLSEYSLHSFMMRLKEEMDQKKLKGIFRAYPLLDNNGKNLWPGKFTNPQILQDLRGKLPEETWIREYLLKILNKENYDYFLGRNLNPFEHKEEYLKAEKDLQKSATNSEKPRPPLVKQMKEFEISAPCNIIYPPRDDVIYKEYDAVIAKIMEKYRQLRMQRIIDETRKMK